MHCNPEAQQLSRRGNLFPMLPQNLRHRDKHVCAGGRVRGPTRARVAAGAAGRGVQLMPACQLQSAESAGQSGLIQGRAFLRARFPDTAGPFRNGTISVRSAPFSRSADRQGAQIDSSDPLRNEATWGNNGGTRPLTHPPHRPPRPSTMGGGRGGGMQASTGTSSGSTAPSHVNAPLYLCLLSPRLRIGIQASLACAASVSNDAETREMKAIGPSVAEMEVEALSRWGRLLACCFAVRMPS